MSTGLEFDADMARRIEAVYETRDAARRRQAVLAALELQPGARVIDIGTGPGFLAREMCDIVGPGGRVYGVDTSQPMLDRARERCSAQRWAEFQLGNATELPAEDASFDAAVSVQVFEYVANVDAALAQMYRVLSPGARAVVVSTDWDSVLWHSGDPGRMRRVLAAFEEHCAYSNLPRTLGSKLRSAGFELHAQSVVTQFNPSYDANTYSFHLVRLVSSFAAGRKSVSREEANEWASELRLLGERGEYFFCLNQFLAVVVKPS
jgi:ubiquinone/menaquinone biosynthesis C-methylase UbiE